MQSGLFMFIMVFITLALLFTPVEAAADSQQNEVYYQIGIASYGGIGKIYMGR